MATAESVQAELTEQTEIFNKLRLDNAEPAVLEDTRKRLAELKKSLAALKNASGGKNGGKKKERLLLKTPKVRHARLWPGEMFCREHIERIVKECFVLYGGAQLDTPVFERKDILAGKYGEDQGGEQLALRYGHTVPLARYLAMGGAMNTQSKLSQVGKVYRRDNPVMSKGRMREFTQADFDIAGQWGWLFESAIRTSELGKTGLPAALKAILKSAAVDTRKTNAIRLAAVFEVLRVGANLCTDHDVNRGLLLEAGFPQTIVSILEGYVDLIPADHASQLLPLSIPHLKVAKTAIGILLNATVGYGARPFLGYHPL
ncbi:class II aaRS and biotin synthetase [Auriscalpium vulgare]|uniref:Class II aaRS and biotin synthetase n=1 Tax=Auriscalpium vulgare TaxID=40419 RepID=A0ACB8R1G4_9AGAM|nr:class II aaRS and biotin synthetase [Auriscalpium vulgare]